MTATEKYIQSLLQLKTGDLGLLRTHAGQDLSESVEGFDLFSGLWWPLRQKSERAPRRDVAWLIAKLYASRPIPHSPDALLARQLRLLQPGDAHAKKRFQRRFDEMLMVPIEKLETPLRAALDVIASTELKLDWVQLTDDLSLWERESPRLRWAHDFLYAHEGGTPC